MEYFFLFYIHLKMINTKRNGGQTEHARSVTSAQKGTTGRLGPTAFNQFRRVGGTSDWFKWEWAGARVQQRLPDRSNRRGSDVPE